MLCLHAVGDAIDVRVAGFFEVRQLLLLNDLVLRDEGVFLPRHDKVVLRGAANPFGELIADLGNVVLLGHRGLLDQFLQLIVVFGDSVIEVLQIGDQFLFDLLNALLGARFELRAPVLLFFLEIGERFGYGLFLHFADDVSGKVEDALKVARRNIEQLPQAAGRALEVPDVADRGSEFDVPHALAAHAGTGNFHAALVANDALVAVALVLAAIALIVFRRAENTFAEETVALRLERAVVDRLRLGYFAVGPTHYLLG